MYHNVGRRDGDTYIIMIIHYNCSLLLHYFLLIYHPYPTSFHEMIFILVYIESDMSVLQFSCCLYTPHGVVENKKSSQNIKS